MKKNLREAQLIMFKILEEVDCICKKNNIEYWLSDGTLLGAVRHGGFIPWDDDLDISMTRENFDKFLDIVESEISNEFFVQTIYTDKEYDILGVPLKIRYNKSLFIEKGTEKKLFNKGIYIDIFPMDRIPKNNLKYKMQRNFTKLCMCVGKPFLNIKSISDVFKNSIKILFLRLDYKTSLKLIRKLINNEKKNTKDIYTYGLDTTFSQEYKAEDLFPLSEIMFEGKKFYAPKNSHEILEVLYGDYMKIPPESERGGHADIIEIYKE